MSKSPFSRIENSLEFVVERPFALLFRRSVQPAEIGKQLKRELTSGDLISVLGRVAPNDYSVHLNPQDVGPYLEHGRTLGKEMSGWLEEVALTANVTTLGLIRVRFESDPSVKRGRFEIVTRVLDADPGPQQFADPGQTEAFEINSSRSGVPSGYVEICSGPETGAVFPIRKRQITVGRDLSNDLVIDSAQVSRFHAEVHVFEGGMAVSDRNSMNGTFVNGLQVVGWQTIDSGDQIVFGTSVCRYWRELL